MTVLSAADFHLLWLTRPPLDSFGPGTDREALYFELSSEKPHRNPEIAAWLRRLPCPVIGIGPGYLKEACDVILPSYEKVSWLKKSIAKAPIAAMVLVQHLRASESLSVEDALTAESFAFAALQTGPEFLAWKNSYEGETALSVPDNPLWMKKTDDGELELCFEDAGNQNAIGIEMRDALCGAFDLAAIDDEINWISLEARGKAFSIGGPVEEFGHVSDPATAHWIRTLRLPARRAAALGKPFHVYIQGAAVGAGIELAAFGTDVRASEKAWFQLPELKYGLIPGAGGTVSITRRIGRQRMAYWALSMQKISAKTALEWGLIDGGMP